MKKKSAKQRKKLFKIPCHWEMYAVVPVKAWSLEDAISELEMDGPLPKNCGYVDGSFGIDHDAIDQWNDGKCE